MDSTDEFLSSSSSDLSPAKPITQYKDNYHSYSCNVMNGNFQEALRNCKQMVKISKYSYEPKKWSCTAMILSSGVNERLGCYENAIRDAKEALKVAQTTTLQANCHFSLGNAYCGQMKIPKATSHFLTSLQLSRDTDDPLCMQNALGGLGLVYMLLRDYETALHCFTEQIKLVKQQPNHSDRLAIPYHNLTQAYRKLGNTACANRYAKMSLYQSSSDKDHYTHASTLLEISSEQLGNTHKIEENLNKAEKIFSDMGCKQGLCRLGYRKAKLFLSCGRADEAQYTFKAVYNTAKHMRDSLMQLKCSYWLSRITDVRGGSLSDSKHPRKVSKLMDMIAPKCDYCGQLMSDKQERLNILTCAHICHSRCILLKFNYMSKCPVKNCNTRINTEQLTQFNLLSADLGRLNT